MMARDFSGYRLIEKLGGGNTGIVYKAFDPGKHTFLAVKILTNDFLVSKERIARFNRETRAARLLSHPSIARMLRVGTSDDGHHFIAMEYVDGEGYNEIISNHSDGVTEENFYKLMMPLLDGVAYAHEHNLVHRDLKPENLKITSTGEPKVLDFGLVKFLDNEPSGEDSFQTMAGMVLGSAGYMSPEQAEGLSFDARTDIFSLGVIMYEFLAGKNPFHSSSPFATIAKILTIDPLSLELLRPELPLRLCKVIMKCLTKNMDARYANARTLIEAINEIKGG